MTDEFEAVDSVEEKTTPAGAGVAVREGAVRNGKRGRWTRHGGQLTERQALFVSNFVSNGGDKRSAVVAAGYTTAYPVQVASQMLALPHIQEALRKERAKYISGDLANLALNTMKDLLGDKATPAATRFQTAKWVLEEAGHRGGDSGAKGLPDPDKPLSAMSLEELETFIAAGKQALERNLIEGEWSPVDEGGDQAGDSDNAQDNALIAEMLGATD